MAVIFPDLPLQGTRSNAERKVFFALKDLLPNEYTVFHSVAMYRSGSRGQGLIDGEIDFVVAHPEKGILVIEVKGGGITFDPLNGRWHSVDVRGKNHEIKNPYEQAKTYKYALIKDLNEASETRRYSYPVGHAVWFPDISIEMYQMGISPRLKSLTLDADGLEKVVSAIPELFNVLLGEDSYRRPPGQAGIEALIKTLAPSWNFEITLFDKVKQNQVAIRAATQAQYRVLTLIDKISRVLISGCAGSGKTLLAVEKARRLSGEGKSVLLLCYNKDLASWINLRVADQMSIDVCHFHGLCAEFCVKAGIPVPKPDPTGSDDFYKYILPEALIDAMEIFDKRYDAIIVDEGQDFQSTWWIAIQELLVDPEEGNFIIFYDDNQKIYTEENSFPFSQPEVSLTENCRNTKSIHECVMRYYRGDKSPIALGPDGLYPEIISVPQGSRSLEAVAKLLKRLVHEDRIEPQDIAVLTPLSEGKSSLKEGHKVGNLSVSWRNSGKKTVICSSVHSFKGLEKSVIIFTEIEKVHKSIKQEILYVAMSRARNHLILVLQENYQLDLSG